MPLLNFNGDDPNNPLHAILNGRPMAGSTGFNVSGAFSTLQSGRGGYSAENGDPAGPGRVTPEQLAAMQSMGLTTDTQMESPVTSFSGQTFKGDDGTVYSIDQTGDIIINGKVYSQLNSLNVGGPGGVRDPSKVTYDPRFGLVTDPSNINNIYDTGYGNAVFAAGAAGLALPTVTAALGGAAGGSPAGVAYTDAAESGGTLAVNSAGTEVTPYFAGDVGTVGTEGIPDTVGLPGSEGVPVSEGATPIPGDGSNFAPVSEGSTPIPGASTGTGWIDGARGAWNGVNSWMNGLSPASRFLLGTAVSQGAGAIYRGIAARNAAAQQRAIIDQHRNDVIRRGQVPAFSSGAFKPKSPAGG